jgi:feruloyl esterase
MIVSAAVWSLLANARVNAATCESLRSLSLPNVTITASETLEGSFTGPTTRAGQPVPVLLPKRCRVAAVLTPSADSHIEMELWMPVENWNGKFEAIGNSGWAGAISYGNVPLGIPESMVAAISDGYATASTDTGHKNDGTQGRFALGHPEKLIDFAYRAVHEMAVTSKAVIAAFYGNAPRLSYWMGCSTGGRQGLVEAQRFPEDFDGIVAGAPANNWVHMMVATVAAGNAARQGRPGNLPTDKLTLLHDAVMRSCDKLDGVEDGVLRDPRRCTFDIATLLCTANDDPATCLTTAQVEAARQIYSGARNPETGAEIFPGLPFGSELGWSPTLGVGSFPIAESYMKDVVQAAGEWNAITLDVVRDSAAADRIDNGLITAVEPNLQRFFDRGGKLLQYHGWSDPSISPFNSINYYRSVEARLGGSDAIDNSYRLFMVPGMMHCGNGDGANQFNAMAVLERWREKDIAPDAIVASHVSQGVVDRTQALCPFPQVAVYSGNGSTRDAANYVCKVVEPLSSSR